MRTRDIAWLAGIVEGEGAILVNPGGIKLQVRMCDEDIIRRLAACTGVGRVNGPYAGREGHHKSFWAWNVATRMDAAGILMTIYPFMGERRQARIREALAAWRARPNPTAPCGTRSAYARHLRRGETTCAPCRAAQARYKRERTSA